MAVDTRIGDILVDQKVLTLDRLDEGVLLAERWQIPLGEVLMARGFVRPRDYSRALATQYGLPIVDLIAEPVEDSLLDEAAIDHYATTMILPWRRKDGTLLLATTNPGPAALLAARKRYGDDFRFVITAKFDVIWTLQRVFEAHYTRQALDALADEDPENSARTVFSIPQLLLFYALFCGLVLGLALRPVATLIAFNSFMAMFFLGNFALKTVLAYVGGGIGAERKRDEQAELRRFRDEELPIYSVLVPMFREPEVLPILARALRELDYPMGKLDIKLVLEAGDHETIDAAKALGLESNFEIIRVPPSQPQTKPKACNYALHFARGEFLVIYDAEDKPEPDQLKKVLLAFKRAPANTVCIQARLNYYNSGENWLTRMFTLDYSLWFDLMLPGLERLGIPIPLGGTSNHFKIGPLRELRAWDPYNVTEDADLGVRITQKGYRVGTVDSTTFEEANCHQGNWIRQRSRWLKGYMQTWLVHMRHPVELFRTLGPIGFFGFQFFIGGTILASLANPLFWTLYLVWIATRTGILDAVFPGILLYLALFNLLIGNSGFIYLSIIAPVKRGLYGLVPYGFTVFYYWVLLSIAGYKGLWQLIHKPFFWEKTQHGLSKVTAAEVAKALAQPGVQPRAGASAP